MASLAEARNAKAAVLGLFEHHDAVNGVGIARTADGYAVKVNLNRSPPPDLTLLVSVEGVPIIWEEVGEVHKRED